MYNRELQSIDNQGKAYLLGLFYAVNFAILMIQFAMVIIIIK